MSPLSDVMGIDFNSIIRTSPTSLVAYINGSRSSPSSHPTLSPVQSEGYGHFLGVKGCCIPQAHPYVGSSQALAPQSVCGRMQMLEEGGGLESQMANMVVEQQCLPDERGALGKASGSCSETTNSLMPLQLQPAQLNTNTDVDNPQGPPPPYHSHQHIHITRRHGKIKPVSQDPLAEVPMIPTRHGVSFLPQIPMLEEEEGELEDYGAHCCRWLNCSAIYEQKEELVRHIEKIHVDQRKAEDFTCYWVGCPRNFKPFNARYKLLIHMRVHSGEKPNKCTVYHAECSRISSCSAKVCILFSNIVSLLLLFEQRTYVTAYSEFRWIFFYFVLQRLSSRWHEECQGLTEFSTKYSIQCHSIYLKAFKPQAEARKMPSCALCLWPSFR